MHNAKRCLCGIGVVEVLVVLALLGVMAGGAVPGVHRINQEWALLGGTRMIESSLLWARMRAIAANDSLAFIIEQEGKLFYWREPDGTKISSTEHWLPAGIRIISSPKKPLRFYQHGNAVPAGTFVVQGAAGTYRVIVNVQGRIRIQRD
jgi:type II secretory pathway pseudopilin PulG